MALMSSPAAALAGPRHAAADWTKLHPGQHPSARHVALASDPANGTVVLFGAGVTGVSLSDTWTWDGTSWTDRHPAHHPPARHGAALAYDPAHHTVVLFGGFIGVPPNVKFLGDTWTWDGTDWTQQHPTDHPRARFTQLVTDPANYGVLLEGGVCCAFQNNLADTWTWNGSDWTEQHPAHPLPPNVGTDAGMAADPSTDTVVAFGGGSAFVSPPGLFHGTWTWNGSDWTQQHPAHHPSGRIGEGMAFDPVSGTVILFGGLMKFPAYSDQTWSWNGSDWTLRHPAPHPSAREVGMATDLTTCSVVIFGGNGPDPTANPPVKALGDTWVYASDRPHEGGRLPGPPDCNEDR
jgi:hypothetical protein